MHSCGVDSIADAYRNRHDRIRPAGVGSEKYESCAILAGVEDRLLVDPVPETTIVEYVPKRFVQRCPIVDPGDKPWIKI